MLRTATAMALMASALTVGAAPALAQDVVSPRQARLEVARQYMKLACQPLEARGQYTRAARCYSNVTAFLSDPTITEVAPVRPVRVAAAQIDLPVAPAPVRYQRSTSSLLGSNHVLLGVGY